VLLLAQLQQTADFIIRNLRKILVPRPDGIKRGWCFGADDLIDLTPSMNADALEVPQGQLASLGIGPGARLTVTGRVCAPSG
jgi:hypothetical protein